MNKFKILIITFLIIATGFSLSVIDSEDGKLDLKIWGQSSAFYCDNKSNYSKGFDLGKYRMKTTLESEAWTYSLNIGYEEKNLELIELSANYTINEYISVNAGIIRAPFGFFSKYDSDILMFDSGTEEGYLLPESVVGVSSELVLRDSTIIIGLGAFTDVYCYYYGNNREMNYSGILHYMPFGYMDLNMSSANRYNKLKLDIASGFFYNNLYDRGVFGFNEKFPTMKYGFQSSLRYSYLSFDAMAYNTRSTSDYFVTCDIQQYSAQLGYALWGKLEPSVRYIYSEHEFECFQDDILATKRSWSYDKYELCLQYYLERNMKIGVHYSDEMTIYYSGLDLSRYRSIFSSVYRVYVAFEI